MSLFAVVGAPGGILRKVLDLGVCCDEHLLVQAVVSIIWTT